jgi:hypothetical protein
LSVEKRRKLRKMACKICGREARAGNYYPFHARAHGNIVQSFAFWKKGLKIRWKEYLREIKENCLTGEWAKEVSEHLIRNEEMENDKKS